MKRKIGLLAVGFFLMLLMGTDKMPSTCQAEAAGTPRILVAYYSQKGHTEEAARDFQQRTGADLFFIQPAVPYPEAHDACLKVQIAQVKGETRPAVASRVENMDQYDVIFVGYPIWCYVEPMVIDTFLESYDFSGKTVIPFCTSGGYPITDSVQRIKKCIPLAKVSDGIRANSAADRAAFVQKMGLAK